MLIDSLSNINLHDSELVNVIIENPRSRLIMHLLYVEDYKTMRTSQKRLLFSGCMKALIDLNLGVLTPDSLRTGHEIEQSAIIDELKEEI